MRNLIKNNRGQIWVETVIYTLIGLSVIGILLAVATPKINEMKDRLRINEAIDILSAIDSKINEVKVAPSNIRYYDLTIAKGKVILNASANTLTWIIETNYKYSEPGTLYPLGELNILTTGDGYYTVSLERKLDFDLTVNGLDTGAKTLEVASRPYSLAIKNTGSYSGNLRIDIATE